MKKRNIVILIVLGIAMFFVFSACPPRHRLRRHPRKVIVIPFSQVLPDIDVTT